MSKSSDSQAIELSVHIAARPETIFQFFSDPERFRLWMGRESEIDPRAGGELTVIYPPGPPTRGRIVEWVANERLVFTWGHGPDAVEEPNKPTGKKATSDATHDRTSDVSQVTITLKPVADGTLVVLKHTGIADDMQRFGTASGWRFYLGSLSNVVWNVGMQCRLDTLIDDYLATWNETDGARRMALLKKSFAENGSMRDRYGCIDGREALNAYIGGVQMMMQGAELERSGPIEQCHSFARYPWRIVLPNGQAMAGGMQFVELDADGLILRSVGFWDGGAG